MRGLLILALLLLSSLPASAGWPLKLGGIAISSPPVQSIASINLSPTSFVTSGGTSTVGTTSVTMSPASPSFSGTLVLGTGSGCAGTDNAGFSLSGATLQTTEPAGTYSIGLVATQGGINNSPFCQEFTVTGSAPSANAVQTTSLDPTTSGQWIGHYGADGYDIALIASSPPSYATVSVTGTTTSTPQSGYSGIPENPDGTTGTNFNWWNSGTVDINVTDGHSHRVTMYYSDLYGGYYGRYTAKDGDSNATLLTSHISDGRSGIYQTFLVTGHIIIQTNNSFSAVYFDPPVPALGLLDYAIASSGGTPVPLNITAPIESGASLTTSVTSLPTNGTVTLADGTPVTVSESLSLAQLAGLKVTPSTLSTTAASTFSYTVSDGSHSSTGNVPISVEVVPSPPSVSSCTAAGYEQAGSVTSDSGAMSVLVPTSGIAPGAVGVLVNDLNVNSIMTAHYFVAKHGIPPGNVFHFSYPFIQSQFANYTMDQGSFDPLLALIPSNIQMLALTWNEPFIQKNDNWANTLGSSFFYNTNRPPTNGSADQPGWTSGYSNYWLSQPVAYPYSTDLTQQAGTLPATVTPFTDLSVRPNMFVTGFGLVEALALIDRGAAGQTLMPAGTAYSMETSDVIRDNPRVTDQNATVGYWNASGALAAICKDNYYYLNSIPYYPNCSPSTTGDNIINTTDVLTLQGGWAHAPIFGMTTNTYVPGSEADLLTSTAGELLPGPGYSEGSILSLLQDGATGSYGWVGEPGASAWRFPAASVLTQQYFRGRTLGEALGMSVADPGNSEFVGDPLARPWGTTAVYASGTLTLRTTTLPPSSTTTYSLKAASSCGGTYTTLQSGITPDPTYLKFKTITDSSGFHPFYQITSP